MKRITNRVDIEVRSPSPATSPRLRFNDDPEPPTTAERAAGLAAAMEERRVRPITTMRASLQAMGRRWPWSDSADHTLEVVDLRNGYVAIRPKAGRRR